MDRRYKFTEEVRHEIAEFYNVNPDNQKAITEKYNVSIAYVGECWEDWYNKVAFPKSEAYRSLKQKGLI